MFDLIKTAHATAIGCAATLTLLGVSATAAADPDNAASNDTLTALIQSGSGSCQVGKPYPEDPFLARLGCGQSTQHGGPYGAVYSLYGSPGDVDSAFGRLAGSGRPIPCPGAAGPEPVSWGGGMVVCTTAAGPSDGAPTVSWSKTADLFVGSAMGSDLAALYTWWLAAR